MPEYQFSKFPTLDYASREAINTLCSNLSFLGIEKKKLLFTSTQAHEGKSFVSLMAADTLARLGYSVVLVDADLRRSQISARYGLMLDKDANSGLTHYLAGKSQYTDILYYSHTSPLCLVPVGRTVTNSLSLLTSTRFTQLLSQLEQQFDFIIIDAPPLGPIIDAAEIAKNCDGCIFVVKYNATSYREAQEVKLQLERVGCPLLGAVLNNVDFDTLSSKKYYHKSYYSRHDSDYYRPEKRKKPAAKPDQKGKPTA